MQIGGEKAAFNKKETLGLGETSGEASLQRLVRGKKY